MSDETIHVLLVEDNPGDRQLIGEILADAGDTPFQLESVARLTEGLERIARGGFDLVLLDLSLPESHGLETFTRMNDAAPALPIVVLTALDDEDVAHHAVQQGAQDYLLKGHVDSGLLVRSMHYAVERKHVDAALREARDTLAQRVEERTAELRRANESLRQSEERYALARRAARIGSWERDLATGRLHWSDEIEPMFGLEQGTFPGTRDAFFQCVHAADRQSVTDAVQACVEGGRQYDTEHRVVWPDGTVRWVHETGNVVRNAAGEAISVVGIVQDITPRKEAETESRRLHEQVRYAQKLESLGVLAGGIAHDFNNLLMAILGNAEQALAEMPSSSPALHCIREIRQATIRASELTNQLLAYSGKGQFLVELVDLNTLVEEMSRLLSVSISKKVALHTDFADHLHSVEADAAQIRQVAMNLITNASEAIGNQPGVITIRTGVVNADPAYLAHTALDHDLPEGAYVFLEVADTGCGMDEEARSRLFDPFFTTKFTGRGLGLAAAQGIVRGHGGAITVESAPGQGAVFRVLLPSAGEPGAAATAGGADPAARPDWQGSGTLLVVDDEEAVRRVAKSILERCGFTVLDAGDGREAVRIFEACGSDVLAVVLDMTMPHMDGEETLTALRQIRSDVPVVLTSGYGEQSAAERIGAQEGVCFIQKPFEIEALLAKVRQATEGGGCG